MFEHFHIPYAIWVDSKIEVRHEFKNKKVFVICQRGVVSLSYAQKLRDAGVDAYSIEGGTIEWSYHDLPRERAGVCIKNHQV